MMPAGDWPLPYYMPMPCYWGPFSYDWGPLSVTTKTEEYLHNRRPEMSALTPLGDRVLVRPLETASETPGGIVLPDEAKDRPTRGKVLAVGPGRRTSDGHTEPPAVSEGDTVVYPQFGGTAVEVDGEELVILSDGELLAKLA